MDLRLFCGAGESEVKTHKALGDGGDDDEGGEKNVVAVATHCSWGQFF